MYCLLLLTDMTFGSWGINSSGVQNEPPHVPVRPIHFCFVCIQSVFQYSVGYFNNRYLSLCRFCKVYLQWFVTTNFLLPFLLQNLRGLYSKRLHV